MSRKVMDRKINRLVYRMQTEYFHTMDKWGEKFPSKNYKHALLHACICRVSVYFTVHNSSK